MLNKLYLDVQVSIDDSYVIIGIIDTNNKMYNFKGYFKKVSTLKLVSDEIKNVINNFDIDIIKMSNWGFVKQIVESLVNDEELPYARSIDTHTVSITTKGYLANVETESTEIKSVIDYSNLNNVIDSLKKIEELDVSKIKSNLNEIKPFLEGVK